MGPEELVRFAREEAAYDRIFVERKRNASVPPKIGTMHGLFIVPDYEPMLPASYAAFLDAEGIWHGQLDLSRSGGALRHSTSAKLMDLFSVRYYADVRGYRQNGESRRTARDLQQRVRGERVKGGDIPVYRRRRAMPRAYVVHQTVSTPSPEEALALVRAGLDEESGSRRRFDPRKQVVLIGDAPVDPRRRRAKEFARIEEYSLNRAQLSVRCESRCIVVLTDLFDPGWQVEVDGEPGEILRANYLFRAVALEAGKHRVEFSYRPVWFYTGAAISAASLIGVLACAFWQRSRPVEGAVGGALVGEPH